MSQRIYDFRKAIGDDMKNTLETNIFRFSALYDYIYKDSNVLFKEIEIRYTEDDLRKAIEYGHESSAPFLKDVYSKFINSLKSNENEQ